jgi:hypothetical protein
VIQLGPPMLTCALVCVRRSDSASGPITGLKGGSGSNEVWVAETTTPGMPVGTVEAGKVRVCVCVCGGGDRLIAQKDVGPHVKCHALMSYRGIC